MQFYLLFNRPTFCDFLQVKFSLAYLFFLSAKEPRQRTKKILNTHFKETKRKKMNSVNSICNSINSSCTARLHLA